jgi:hypothetical protein
MRCVSNVPPWPFELSECSDNFRALHGVVSEGMHGSAFLRDAWGWFPRLWLVSALHGIVSGFPNALIRFYFPGVRRTPLQIRAFL